MRSESPPPHLLLVLLVLAVVAGTASMAIADVINTGRFVIAADQVQDEDVYVAATTGRVDGRIDGDLLIAVESLQISGVVTGDVLVAARGTVHVSGVVMGSVRGVARRVVVDGEIGDDLAVAAWSVATEGDIGRDVIGLAMSSDVAGAVGRDVRGRFRSLSVDGAVGRDVDVTAGGVELGSDARVDGDVVYQSAAALDAATGAEIGGQVIQLPTTLPFSVALVVNVVGLVSFLGYLLGGILVLWLMRSTAHRAVAAITLRPGVTLGVGFAGAVFGPVLLAALAASLVGIPIALAVLAVMVVGLFFGSVPFVSAVGTRILRGRGGLYGGFILVAVTGRLLAALWSPLGVAIYAVALLWGIGGWLVGIRDARRATPMPHQLVSENSSRSVPDGSISRA